MGAYVSFYLELCKRSSIRKPIPPFTDWQNDLHLIVDIAHAISLCSRIDLAKLKRLLPGHFLVHILLAPAKIGAGMFAAESHTSRHRIAIVAMACLCVLLGGPSYAAGAESLFIAGATYCEPGVSGPGWAWTDAGHLELDGYAGDAIGADGDLVVTLAGQNSVVESHAPDADIAQCGMEVWGDLTLRGTGSLAASGSQCAIHVSRALVVDGCAVDARADGAGVTDEAVAGVIAGGMAVRGLSVDASWLDASGADGGSGSSVEQPGAGSATDPVLKPATTTSSTTTTTKTTATKTAASTLSRARTANAAAATLPKTAASNWIAASLVLFLLGTALVFVNVVIAVLGRPKRKGD